MKKIAITAFASGFLGIIIGSITTKIMTDSSPYEWLTQWITDIIDKPFIQTHGMCILILGSLSFITYYTIHLHASLNAQRVQDILQSHEKNSAKILNKLSKLIKKGE